MIMDIYKKYKSEMQTAISSNDDAKIQVVG